jgi:predicted TIM-barrel fold metal-dependent hydrolase
MRCDCHVHIVGSFERYPQIATRTYLAGVASLEELRRCAAPRKIERFVIVQPSFYGTDNTLLLESLDSLGGQGRGVAVLETAETPGRVLADYARRGVRGLRVNLYSTEAGRQRPLDRALREAIELARACDWHVELIAPLQTLLKGEEAIARADVPIVIDHYGLYGSAAVDSIEGQALLALLRHPHVWIKLSAPYRVSDDPLNTQPDRAWLTAILAAAPDRCVWGSDWPHTPPREAHKGPGILVPYRALSYESLVDDFLDAVGSVELAERIMQENPARLYGF